MAMGRKIKQKLQNNLKLYTPPDFVPPPGADLAAPQKRQCTDMNSQMEAAIITAATIFW